jgi:hypothetical protein
VVQLVAEVEVAQEAEAQAEVQLAVPVHHLLHQVVVVRHQVKQYLQLLLKFRKDKEWNRLLIRAEQLMQAQQTILQVLQENQVSKLQVHTIQTLHKD